jgi:S-methylmethionine-dependent homocysteine/selenocysteine methylase
LHNKGIRFFAFETIPTLEEAKYAKQLLEEIDCDGWITATCRVSTYFYTYFMDLFAKL